jgi:hypothetical protein
MTLTEEQIKDLLICKESAYRNHIWRREGCEEDRIYFLCCHCGHRKYEVNIK